MAKLIDIGVEGVKCKLYNKIRNQTPGKYPKEYVQDKKDFEDYCTCI